MRRALSAGSSDQRVHRGSAPLRSSGALDGEGDDIVDVAGARRNHHDAVEAERHAGAGRQAGGEGGEERCVRRRGPAGRVRARPRRPRNRCDCSSASSSSWKPLASSSPPQNASNREATGPRMRASAACEAGKSRTNVMRSVGETAAPRAWPSRGRAARPARRRAGGHVDAARRTARLDRRRRAVSGSTPSAASERLRIGHVHGRAHCAQRLEQGAQQRLDVAHQRVVVHAEPVPLDHRELGVVASARARLRGIRARPGRCRARPRRAGASSRIRARCAGSRRRVPSPRWTPSDSRCTSVTAARDQHGCLDLERAGRGEILRGARASSCARRRSTLERAPSAASRRASMALIRRERAPGRGARVAPGPSPSAKRVARWPSSSTTVEPMLKRPSSAPRANSVPMPVSMLCDARRHARPAG